MTTVEILHDKNGNVYHETVNFTNVKSFVTCGTLFFINHRSQANPEKKAQWVREQKNHVMCVDTNYKSKSENFIKTKQPGRLEQIVGQ